ncbi:MAG: glycoside hydrolase family 2 protein [Bryobacteraceae bacterium]
MKRLLLLFALPLAAADWKPAEGPLQTPWTAQVTPKTAWTEHPRPQMMRRAWTNLNGLWEYAITPKEQGRPAAFEGQILVPFAVESALSGVKRALAPNQRLWYRRTFPASKGKGRTLLHFEAVDWRAEVWVNGRQLGTHEGGYDPFTFDITEALKPGGAQELVVAVWDPTSDGNQPRGKQVLNPNGIWYTAVSGIWQTVWLESVPEAHITALVMTPDLDRKALQLRVEAAGAAEFTARALLHGRVVGKTAGKTGQVTALPLDRVEPWSPDAPALYDLEVSLKGGDSVKSYFGMRKIAVKKDAAGVNRLFLNDKPLFMIGPLDQGWWPDGLYTAPTDAALRFDVETTRKLGFNMARKHVKVEPARWYYWCDRLGLMVWQDMPSGFVSREKNVKKGAPHDAAFTPEEAAVFRRELEALVRNLRNEPCIIAWVPFNEGWGQHNVNAILQQVKQWDPSRLVDAPSGWEDRGWGDMKDIHAYPGPSMFPVMPDRASVLGEFGGLGLPLEGHLWWNKRNWGYRTFDDRAKLQAAYDELIAKLKPLVEQGLAAAVYTQTSDVEGEVNGLMTYDRKVIKFDAARLAEMHRGLAPR